MIRCGSFYAPHVLQPQPNTKQQIKKSEPIGSLFFSLFFVVSGVV